MPEQRCTCSGEFWLDGERIVTVGCPVHHLMEDGAPACEHEVRCMCGNFADDRKCALFTDTEEDEEPFYVCVECQPFADNEEHLERAA